MDLCISRAIFFSLSCSDATPELHVGVSSDHNHPMSWSSCCRSAVNQLSPWVFHEAHCTIIQQSSKWSGYSFAMSCSAQNCIARTQASTPDNKSPPSPPLMRAISDVIRLQNASTDFCLLAGKHEWPVCKIVGQNFPYLRPFYANVVGDGRRHTV